MDIALILLFAFKKVLEKRYLKGTLLFVK